MDVQVSFYKEGRKEIANKSNSLAQTQPLL